MRIRQAFAFALLLSCNCFGQSVDEFTATNKARFKPVVRKIQFGLIGDQQYTALQEKKFEAVIDSMNSAKLSFVHDGDIVGSKRPCDDATFVRRLVTFNRSRHPFILTPGDNDWTDCGRESMGSFDPLERLAKLRLVFYPKDRFTLGEQRLAVLSQSQISGFEVFVENLMWAQGEVLFLTLQVVGSNNNAAAQKEFKPRDLANQFWLKVAFRIAKQQGFRAVLVVMQANPHFEAKTRPATDGFTTTLNTLEEQSLAFAGQVVLVHGDSHYFRIDKPMISRQRSSEGSRLENFMRVETFGPPDVHWVLGTADPKNPMVLLFEQRLVPQNIVR